MVGFNLNEMSRIGKPLETETRLSGCLEPAGWRERVNANGHRISLGGDENVLKLIVVMAEQWFW